MRDFQDVLTLHNRFDFPRSEFTTCPTPEVFNFRRQFLHEELDEYHRDFGRGNLVGVVDGLLDFVYVCLGTSLFVGVPRYGMQSIWPTFATARQALINQDVMDEMRAVPQFLPASMHLYTISAMRSRTVLFENAYHAACEEVEGAAALLIVQLKQAIDEAYKAAALMAIPWDRCWRHVVDANLHKRPGPVAKRGNIKWDLTKPKDWTSPNARIATELMLEGWRIPKNMHIDNDTGKVEMEI